MKVLEIILSFVLAFVVLYMAFAIGIRYPDNHADSLFTLNYFFAVVLLGAAIIYFKTATLPKMLILFSVLGIIALWLIDRQNILVSYDDWIRRGMPEWGQSAKHAKKENSLHNLKSDLTEKKMNVKEKEDDR